jgi:hypothetical protein
MLTVSRRANSCGLARLTSGVCQQVRAGDQQRVGRSQVLDHHAAAVVKRLDARAARHVEAFFDQVDDPVADPHVDVDLRKTRQECRHHRADRWSGPSVIGQATRIVPQGSVCASATACFGRLRLFAHRDAVAVDLLAHGRQRQRARRALQQAHAQPRFEFRDAP